MSIHRLAFDRLRIESFLSDSKEDGERMIGPREGIVSNPAAAGAEWNVESKERECWIYYSF
jgi:hypothetical protein